MKIERQGPSFGINARYRREGGRIFQAVIYWVGWDCISLGAHVCTSLPNVEIHLPFCFIRIGWRNDPNEHDVKYWVAPA